MHSPGQCDGNPQVGVQSRHRRCMCALRQLPNNYGSRYWMTKSGRLCNVCCNCSTTFTVRAECDHLRDQAARRGLRHDPGHALPGRKGGDCEFALEASIFPGAARLCIKHSFILMNPASCAACKCVVCQGRAPSEGLLQQGNLLNTIRLCICQVERLPGIPHDRFSLPAMVPMESTPLTSMPCGVCPVR